MSLRSSILFLLILSFNALTANDSALTWKQWRKSWDTKEIITNHIDLKRESLIKGIEVLDVRSDKERVGVYTDGFRDACELVYDTPIEFLFNRKLCNNTAKETVLLVIRNFWINEVQYVIGKPKERQSVTGGRLPSTKLRCSIDAFIKHEDKYIPLTQVDTIFTDKRGAFYSSRSLTEKALLLIQTKLEEGILADKYLTKKQTDQEFIEKVYSRRFKIAALTDNTFHKGIYLTWEQFKNNQPIKKEFLIKSNKNEPPSLFVRDEKGNEILTRNVFAVSDGSNLYKIHQGFVFPIYRNNNGIYWTGLEKFDLKTQGVPVGFPLGGGWYGYGLEPISTTMKIRVTPYLLNLETGEEY